MKLNIFNAEKAEDEALQKAIQRTKAFANADHINIHVQPRVPADAQHYKNPGWLEYILVIYTEPKHIYMTLAMIQRKPDAEFEFHS